MSAVPSPPTPVERALRSWLVDRILVHRPIGRRFVFSIRIDPPAEPVLPYFLTVWQWNEGRRLFDVFDVAVFGTTRAEVWAAVEAELLAQAPGGVPRFSISAVGGGAELELDVDPGEPPLLVSWGPTLTLEDELAGDDRHFSPVIYGRPNAPAPEPKDDAGEPLLPTAEYIVVTGGTRRKIGTDYQGEPDAELEFVENVGARSETLDILVISPRASSLASLIQGATEDSIELVELSKLGLGVVDFRTVVDGSVALSTMWQQRAALSVEVSFSERTFFDAQDRIIESVEATGGIVGLPPATITEP